MSNIRYLNQAGNPFWDWVASLEQSSSNHPFFAPYNSEPRNEPRGPPPDYGPSSGDAPPPPPPASPPAPEAPRDPPPPPHDGPFGPGFPFGSRRGGPHHHHHHGGPHSHGRGAWGGWSGRGRGGRCGGRGRDGWPMGSGGGGNFDMSRIADFISQFVPEEVMASAREGFTGTKDTSDNSNKDFTPPADIFDTEDAYIVHISLPGAKKEDVGVNWDADNSELNVAGVIYRPGDEALLKTLALDERHVGVFERKVKLGSKANVAQVDADGISARMEEGVLMVTIPKLDNDIVEVKKVDIE